MTQATCRLKNNLLDKIHGLTTEETATAQIGGGGNMKGIINGDYEKDFQLEAVM